MSFSNTFENSILALLLNATAIANIADNAASSPLSVLYLALHTADPGETGTQSTSETTYTSYARKSVARTTGGFSAPSGGSSALAADQDFVTGTGGSGTVTHTSVGIASSGATAYILSGTATPNQTVGSGIIPRLTTATTFSID
jgi:hypothetical protein